MSKMVTVVSSAPQGKSYPLACDCGWTDSVSARVRSTVIERGRAHLRKQHGGKSCLERRRSGNVRELSGINERLLDEDQREHYSELVRAANLRGPDATPKPKHRMKFRDGMKSCLAMAAWIAILVPLFLLMNKEDAQPEPHPDPFLWLMLAWLLLGWVPAALVLKQETENWRLRLVTEYLDSIEFEHHDPQTAHRGHNDGNDYVSRRWNDHLWYGDHSGLDWRDREQAQSWGMDADTYVSNWLENDKD